MTRVLTPNSDQASAVSASPLIGLRPFLLILPGDDRATALTTAIQSVGIPCLLAFDESMVEYWIRAERPTVTIIDIEPTWARNVGDRLIRRGMVAVAVSSDEDERISALGRGFQDAIPSSLGPREVAARLRQRFLTPPEPAASELPLDGPLRIDAAERRIWWQGEEKHLSPMQFDLLAYLAGRPNTKVSIDTLLREIWREAWGDTNKVTKMIGRIRDALGPGSGAYLISSRGYYEYRTP